MNKLKNLVLQQKVFLSGTFFIFLGSMIGNVAAYFFQLVAGRMLSPQDYGVFIALLSILYFTGIPGTSLQTTLAKTVSELRAKKEFCAISSLFWRLSKYFVLLGSFWFILFFIFQNQLTQFLKISQKNLIFWLALLSSFSFLTIVPPAFLQGLQRFKALASINMIGPFLRFSLGILFLLLGFAVTGILWGLNLAAILTVALGLFVLRKNLREQTVDVGHLLSPMLKFYLPTLLALVALNSFYNSDILLVKHFFTEWEAGLYSATSVLGRIIFFATSSLALVMFPIVSANYTLGKNFRKVFYLALLIVALGSFTITLAYSLFPELFIKMLFGEKYLGATSILGKFGLFMCFYSLSFVSAQFFLAIRKFAVAPIVTVAACLQIILIYFWHNSLNAVIAASLVSTIFLFSVLIFYFFKTNSSGIIPCSKTA